MSGITFFYHPLSQPARAVWSLILATGLDKEITCKELNLGKGEHKAADYVALNPNGNVPFLQDGDFGVYESGAIMRYLCNKYTDKVPDHWYPRDLQGRALVDQYLDWHHTNTRKGVLFFFHRYAAKAVFGIEPVESRKKEGLDMYTKVIKFINDNNLAKNDFVAGPQMTVADLQLYAEIGQVQWSSDITPLLDANPKVKKWVATMNSQPWEGTVMAFVKSIAGPDKQ
eukprot:GFYU01001553.1.p1 GENE.GFYU01001553.1~~GFYU01001553.1.p1  ORF type:complete len:227 (-),score=79.83 GFYU01001553.1:130-810(-)